MHFGVKNPIRLYIYIYLSMAVVLVIVYMMLYNKPICCPNVEGGKILYKVRAWCSTFKGCCGEQVGKFDCVLGQGTKRDDPALCGRQMAQTPRK